MKSVDLVIIGAGPAGLSAAIYAARAGIETHVLGCKPKFAGDYDIDNYFGFSETISGKELQQRGVLQAERFGAVLSCERVLTIYADENGRFKLKTEKRELLACAVILATGVSRVRPGIDNLQDYEGKGVSYCVSCDGFFYRQRPVMVLGGGIYAANQALELLQYTPDVSLCVQNDKVEMSSEFRHALNEAGIAILREKAVTLEGENGLEQVVFESGKKRRADGLFIAMGEASSSDFAYSLGLERDGQFIVADYDQKTNLPGIFAAGDCIGGFLQIAVAVGEGAKAGRSAISHIRKHCKES